MCFLYARGFLVSNNQLKIRMSTRRAATATKQGYGLQSAPPRHVQRLDYVARIAAGCEYQQHVAAIAQGFDLSCKNVIKCKIIAQTTEQGTVCRKCNRRQSGAINFVMPDQFSGEVLRLAPAAAIAANQNLAAIAERGLNGRRDLFDQRRQRFQAF